eukprot:gene226-301_t
MSSSQTNELHKKLKEIFGYDHFRGNQEDIIKSILQGKNTFVSMPTGGGKSLCYQLPAIIREGLAIVISPLIALMKDQVDHLHSRGIKASLLNSTLPQKVVNNIKQEVLAGETKLLYIAPETLNKEDSLSFLKQVKISFIAVDEAHCISDWGHDFRPEYRKISQVAKQQLGTIPIIALTATAPPRVQLDILTNLGITDATVFQSSFNRPNLYYEIKYKEEEQADKQLIKLIKEQPQIAGIVYCQSRKHVDKLAALLNLNGIKAAPYHAGLDTNLRIKHQEEFFQKQHQVIVATIAFGMGINAPDLRFVIHYDMPKSLEAYYQETGRAGRDGLPSTCIMLYNPEDFIRLERLTKMKSNGEREKSRILLEEMKGYIVSGICRRKQLLYYFGESFDGNCENCDNCTSPIERFEASNYLQVVLEVVQQTQSDLDLDSRIEVIQGVQNPHIASYKYKGLPIFGQGSKQSESFWKSIFRQSLIDGYLTKEFKKNDCLILTKKGQDFLKKKYDLNFVKDNIYEPIENNQKKDMTTHKGYDENLVHLLKKLREKIAKEKGIPAYTVLQDSSLEELAMVYPTTLEELAKVGGLSMGKAIKFGEPFIQAIKKYVEENDIITSSDIVVKSKASRSKDKVYIIQQIDRKANLEEIATAKSQSMDQLLDEIEAICYSGLKLNLNYYIDTVLSKDEQQEIYDYFMQAKEDNIKQAYRALGDYYNEEDIRLIRIKFLSELPTARSTAVGYFIAQHHKKKGKDYMEHLPRWLNHCLCRGKKSICQKRLAATWSCFFLHCASHTVYQHIHTLPKQGWSRANHSQFQFTIADNTHPHQINLILSHTPEYPFQNLYITYYLKDSKGKIHHTALKNHLLFDPKTGKPLGKGLGQRKVHAFALCEDYHFDAPGNYTIEVVQFMRMEDLIGISSVGIQVITSHRALLTDGCPWLLAAWYKGANSYPDSIMH